MINRLKQWLVHHNIITDKEDHARMETLFAQAEQTGDYTEWDAYMKETESHGAPRWWVDRGSRTFSLKPFETGGDEWGRHTYVLGFPWSGRLVIAREKSPCVHHDKDHNRTEVCLVTNHWQGACKPVDVGYGVTLNINIETGTVNGLEIDHDYRPADDE